MSSELNGLIEIKLFVDVRSLPEESVPVLRELIFDSVEKLVSSSSWTTFLFKTDSLNGSRETVRSSVRLRRLDFPKLREFR